MYCTASNCVQLNLSTQTLILLALKKNMKKIGFFKRMLVAGYDGLLLIAVIFFTLALVIGLFMVIAPDSLFVDPNLLENPKLVQLTDTGRQIGSAIFVIHSIAVSFFFYGWFWTHGGQTLGMRAWNLYLIKPDGKFIDWKIACTRYCAALFSWIPLGLGFTWILLNNNKRAWHDIISNTQIVYSPPQKNK